LAATALGACAPPETVDEAWLAIPNAPAAGDQPVGLTTAAMTFNVRWSDSDSNSWSARLDCMSQVVTDQRVDILGLQEIRKDVAPEPSIRSMLQFHAENRGFTLDGFHGATRVDDCDSLDDCTASCDPETGFCATQDGMREQVPIYWDTGRYTLVRSGVHKLPPGVSTVMRTLAWVELRDRIDRQVVAVYNAHLDHHTEGAYDQARVAQEIIRNNGHGGSEIPLILLGDFNLYWSQDEERQILEMFMRGISLDVASSLVGKTFHAFEGLRRGTPVDYAMINDHWVGLDAVTMTRADARCPEVVIACPLEDQGPECPLTEFETNRFPSDHYPVWVSLARDSAAVEGSPFDRWD
jgi:endonuclease/exonuclease/phosphatase family metal-dependent hydrolase